MLHVAMVSFAESGGHPAYVREVVSALHRRSRPSGIAIELVSSIALEERFRITTYPIHCVLPAYPVRKDNGWVGLAVYKMCQFLYPLRVDRAFIAWLRAHPDIRGIHFQDYYNLGTAFHIRRYRRTGKWLVFTVHNIRPHRYYPLCRPLMDALARFTWTNCSALFVHSTQLASDLGKFLGQGHPPIYVTPMGAFVPTPLVQVRSLEARMALRKLLFFGAVRANKGLHTLLDAMNHLEGFGLTIAGAPCADRSYWEGSIVPRIASLRSKGRSIEIIDDFIPEEAVHQLWDSHSVVVLPYTSAFSGQSGVQSHALGLETPMVAGEASGLGHVLAEHRVGEVMTPNDATGLVNALERLYAVPVADLEANLKAARRTLSWERSAEVALDVYLALG